MSSPRPIVPPSVPARVWPMYRAMVGIGLVCGLLIVTVFELTRPVIERNKAEALQRAIFDVLPAAASSETFLLDPSDGFVSASTEGDEKRKSSRRIYAGYDESGELVGLAIEAEGMGYQDVIRLLYGYSIERQAVIGIRVLESKETPGLGDRIETDPDFLRNFEALAVTLGPDGQRVEHAIEGVKHGRKEHPWQVDGITGATISSMAIADILARSTEFWAPRIQQHADQLRKTG